MADRGEAGARLASDVKGLSLKERVKQESGEPVNGGRMFFVVFLIFGVCIDIPESARHADTEKVFCLEQFDVHPTPDASSEPRVDTIHI